MAVGDAGASTSRSCRCCNHIRNGGGDCQDRGCTPASVGEVPGAASVFASNPADGGCPRRLSCQGRHHLHVARACQPASPCDAALCSPGPAQRARADSSGASSYGKLHAPPSPTATTHDAPTQSFDHFHHAPSWSHDPPCGLCAATMLAQPTAGINHSSSWDRRTIMCAKPCVGTPHPLHHPLLQFLTSQACF